MANVFAAPGASMMASFSSTLYAEGAYLGERLLPGDVIYAVSGMPVNSLDSLRRALEGIKNADAIALQVERLGTLHYLVLETDK